MRGNFTLTTELLCAPRRRPRVNDQLARFLVDPHRDGNTGPAQRAHPDALAARLAEAKVPTRDASKMSRVVHADAARRRSSARHNALPFVCPGPGQRLDDAIKMDSAT